MAEYYIFTIFVFALCLMLIFAVKMLILKGGDKQDTEKDEKLMRLYSQVEEMMESFEEYADDIKSELEDEKKKTLRDIRLEADDIKHSYYADEPSGEPDMPTYSVPRTAGSKKNRYSKNNSDRDIKRERNTDRASYYADESDTLPPAPINPAGTTPMKSAADIYKSAAGSKKPAPPETDPPETDADETGTDDENFTEVSSNDDLSKKSQIINMHKNGMSTAEIAKKTNMNISEINLIILKERKK
ncbi:MAG: hypothetical protein J1F64_02945 [Oscillospiraceae bacterium]|nr:hypothetical protein [Oscillospiraceae bacterium]